jgi:DNA-binding IclR family transcriptional regulator
MKRPRSDYSIQTVVNALSVLEAFHDDDELGVTELARRLSLHKNNVFRLLATLQLRGYVEQSAGTERYRLGLRSLDLGHAYARGHSVLRHARPVLEALAGEVQESAHLAVLGGFEVVHLDGEQPARLVASTPRIGRRLPSHTTALGKVLLACGDAALRERFDREVVTRRGLAAATPCSITDRDKFFEHLRAVAGQGYALDLEESESGLCCAAAPVHDGAGGVVAAVSVSGPAFRLESELLVRQIVPAVLAAADRLSRRLGYAG